MAVTTAAVIGAVGAVGSAYSQNKGAKDAARAAGQGSQASIDEQRRQFDVTRQDQMPWLNAGTNALQLQNAFLNGDTSGFENSNDYKWAVDQGFKGLDRGAAARGNLWSGGTDADRIALGQGLATQYAGNYYNRLAGLSGTGQVAANSLGQFGANMATNIGNAQIDAGNRRASSYSQQGQNWGNALNQLSGIGSWYAGQQGQPQNQWGAFTPQDYNGLGANWGQGWGG